MQVTAILFPPQQAGDDRQGILRFEPLGRRGQLRAHLHIGFGFGESGQLPPECVIETSLVAQQPDRPPADMLVVMSEQPPGEYEIEQTGPMQHPQRLERPAVLRIEGDLAQPLQGRGGSLCIGMTGNGRIKAVPQHADGGLPPPFVEMREQSDEFCIRECRQVGRYPRAAARGLSRLSASSALRADNSIDAAAGLVPVVAGIDMRQSRVVPVGYVHTAIRSDCQPHRAEPAVGSLDHRGHVDGAVRRGVGVQFAAPDPVMQGIGRDHIPMIPLRQRAPFVDDERLGKAVGVALVPHVLEEAERIRVRQRAMFAPVLHAVRALRIEHAPRVAVVGAGEHAPFVIHLQREGVAAPLGKDLEHLRGGVIPPYALPEPADVLRHCRRDITGRCGAVRSVQPAVRAPHQTVRDRVRILQSEPREVHHRVAIGNVIPVGIGIEQQIRRVEYPDPPATGDKGCRNIESRDDILVGVVRSVGVGVLEDGDLVRSRYMMRGRRGEPCRTPPADTGRNESPSARRERDTAGTARPTSAHGRRSV